MGAGFGEEFIQRPYLTDKETEVQMGLLMDPFSRSKTGTRGQAPASGPASSTKHTANSSFVG